VAVITNLYKEHLAPADPNNPNYHKSMKAYVLAKANIFRYQKKDGWLVINKKLPISNYQSLINGKKVVYEKSALLSNLIGEHNKENIAAAEAVAKILKIKKETVARAVKSFSGLPHRLEFVAEIGGVKYFDDSFATVPEVSVIALKSFQSDKGANIILLAGGADKGSDFKNFIKEINKKVKYLILFKGKGTEKIKKQILNSKLKIPNSIVSNMKDAMSLANKAAKPGDIVLLSTGCASFGCFRNYKERGDLFRKEVLKK
jgi:UDP-N-acetylmuramoylalanine--D-glutamate ligase